MTQKLKEPHLYGDFNPFNIDDESERGKAMAWEYEKSNEFNLSYKGGDVEAVTAHSVDQSKQAVMVSISIKF